VLRARQGPIERLRSALLIAAREPCGAHAGLQRRVGARVLQIAGAELVDQLLMPTQPKLGFGQHGPHLLRRSPQRQSSAQSAFRCCGFAIAQEGQSQELVGIGMFRR
jgi:hypothetical protein